LQQHTERLGSAPLPSLLVRLSLPGIAATVSASLYNIVDTFWVARLGYEAIAALTIVFPYQILTMAIGFGTGVGISALVSRRFGERDLEATNHVAGHIFFLSLFWGLLFTFIATSFAGRILVALGATPDIIDAGTQYLVITAYGIPAHMFALMTSNVVRGSGDAVKPMVIVLTASVLNIILDPFLIFGIGPFPELGIRGAAWATVTAQSAGALLGLYYLLGRRTAYRLRTRHLVPSAAILRDIYRIGIPASIQEITESLSFVLFNRIVSVYGSVAIAAVGLAIRVSDLIFMPIIGVSNALLPIVGYNYGARNEKRLWQATRLSTIGIAVMLGFFTIIIETLTPQIIRIFSRDPAVLEMTVPAMRIMLSTLCFIGPSIMFVTTFQGLNRGGMALFLSLMRQFLLFVPALYLLNYLWGLDGLWLSLPTSDILSFLLTFGFIYREYRRHRRGPRWVPGQP
jgi:putative MATE family efflux protein